MFNLLAQINIRDNFYVGNRRILSVMGSSLNWVISAIAYNLIYIALIIFFLILVFGGFMYIMSAGNANQEGMEKSKNALTAAVIGLIIVFGAYWIVRIVEYITEIQIFNSVF